MSPYQILTYTQGVSFPGIPIRVSTSSTNVDPDSNIPNRNEPRPKYISNRRCSWANNFFLPQLLSSPEPQSISTNVSPDQISATDVRSPMISVRSQAPPSLDAKDPPDISQRTPRSHELYPSAAMTP